MFFDEVKIKLKAGDGGSGIVSFRREIFVAKGGPDGGDGGDGGSIYVEADPSLSTLSHLRHRKLIQASSGQNGGKKNKKGRRGEDVIIKVPLGTVVYDDSTGELIADLDEVKRIRLAKGGKGGFGNAHFTSSTRQAPTFAERGEPGEQKTIKLELKLIADVGIIGLPNVGKSTLLSRISNASPKIASYPFTTIIPNLGIVNIDNFSFVACDIPGLIEGAHKGKGLGDKFLRHIERCRVIIHLLDATTADLLKDYKTVQNELKMYSSQLIKKPQILTINKIDALEGSRFKARISKFTKIFKDKQVFLISAVSGEGVRELLYEVKKQLEKIPKPQPKPKLLKVFKPYEKLIKIEETEKGLFVVSNPDLERLVSKTDFANKEAILRFYHILKRKGVFKLLKKKGAQIGDRLKIADKIIIISDL